MNVREKIIVVRLIYIIAAFLLTFGLIALCTVLNTDSSYPANILPNEIATAGNEEPPLDAVDEPEDAHEPVRLTFAGTCTVGSMLGSSTYGTFNYMLETEGAGYFLGALSEYFTRDDLTIAGCDVVLSDSDSLEAAERIVPEWYRGPTSAAEIFQSAGVDVLALDCFHAMDYGDAGYADTKAALEAAGLRWGDYGQAVYFDKSGISVAVYCRAVEDENDEAGILEWIANASLNRDFVAVYVTTAETGAHLPDESRCALFRSFIDAGADLVVGTDTAYVQPYEEWGGGYVVYSLGALLDGASKYPEKYTALLGVEIKVIDGKICDVDYNLIPCLTYDENHAWRPSVLTSDGNDD